jgi:DNA-binding transcriptional MerR regulator
VTTTESEAGYTIDELAAKTGVPSRTIRFYQSKGVLPAPTIKGRVAQYGESHAERLALIAQLQDRGLRIDAIRDVLVRVDKGELDVGEWLGLSAQLRAPWADDAARTVTEEQLYELAGTKRPGLVADLVRAGLVERHGDVLLVRSPALLRVAMRLARAGVDLKTAQRAEELLRRYLGRAASELAEHFVDRGVRDDDVEPTAAFEALRDAGPEAVRIVFAQEMEKVLRELVASGRATRLPRKRGKR